MLLNSVAEDRAFYPLFFVQPNHLLIHNSIPPHKCLQLPPEKMSVWSKFSIFKINSIKITEIYPEIDAEFSEGILY